MSCLFHCMKKCFCYTLCHFALLMPVIKTGTFGVVVGAYSIDVIGCPFPLALAIADIEDNNNWNLFMGNLKVSIKIYWGNFFIYK